MTESMEVPAKFVFAGVFWLSKKVTMPPTDDDDHKAMHLLALCDDDQTAMHLLC